MVPQTLEKSLFVCAQDLCYISKMLTLNCVQFVGGINCFYCCCLTLGHTRKLIPPPWYKGGGGRMEPLPGVFDML